MAEHYKSESTQPRLLTVYKELQVVLLVQVCLDVDPGEYAGPQPPQLEVCGSQESLAGEGQVAGRRVNPAPPNLFNMIIE